MQRFFKQIFVLAAAFIGILLLATFAFHNTQVTILEYVWGAVVAPVENAFSQTGYSIRQVGFSSGELLTAYRDNQVLKEEIVKLRENENQINEIKAENVRLRSMLDYKKSAPQFDLVAASVIARDTANWTSTLVINKGTSDGIAKDMPVVTTQGLVGSVISATSGTAKVQLLLDARSAVGVLVQRAESRVAAIVEGYASTPLTPRMVNIPRDADIVKGDRIVTSGFGGMYPKGLMVGEVLDIVDEEGGLLKHAVLKPAVDFDKLEEVMVLVRSREPQPTLPAPDAAAQAGKAAAQKGAAQR